jgi:hypothetical protein
MLQKIQKVYDNLQGIQARTLNKPETERSRVKVETTF